MNPVNIEFDNFGNVTSIRARARGLAEFREQMAKLRRLGVE